MTRLHSSSYLLLILFLQQGASALAPLTLRMISDSGLFRETLLPADIDKDGDMDFYSGNGRGNKSYWFERTGTGWTQRLVSDSDLADVGAALLDVDNDGWPDKISSGLWYRNPGFPKGGLPPGSPDPIFKVCRYSDQEYLHDIYTADVDGDGRPDVVTIENEGIRWFRIPPPDSACGPWKEHMVNGLTYPLQHGGIAAGDIDGDGDIDISRIDRWYENADGKGENWIEHVNIPFGSYYPGGWGLSGRAMITDMDGDGHNDIVQTECDAPNGRVAWFRNRGGKGLDWEIHLIKDSTDGQDFHSLILADFDGDGDRDLFSAGSGASIGVPTAYVWENLDGHGGSWREHVIMVGPLKTHEAAEADLDGDGDLDILGKSWGSGEQFYWENQQVPNPASGVVVPKLKGEGFRWVPPNRFSIKGLSHTADGRRIPQAAAHPPHCRAR